MSGEGEAGRDKLEIDNMFHLRVAVHAGQS